MYSQKLTKEQAFEIDADAAQKVLGDPSWTSEWSYSYSLFGRDRKNVGPLPAEIYTPLFSEPGQERLEIERLLPIWAVGLEAWLGKGSSTALTKNVDIAFRHLRRQIELTRQLRDYDALVEYGGDTSLALRLMQERSLAQGHCPILGELATHTSGV